LLVPRMLYLDCFSGASGDMILGALLDLGLPLDALKGALGSLAIEYGNVAADRVLRAGVSATKFRLVEHAASDPAQSDQHQHHHLKHIVAAIRRSALSKEGQDRAVHLFERLADAEAAIHHTPIERVHLHEVGALDSIIDIVGAVYGFEWFRIDDVMSSPLNVGGGTVRCAHGVFPVPAPATARLLAGVPVYSDGQSEMVTPTGALLVTGYAKQFGPLPAMSIEQIAYGAGERDPKERPNVLRILRGTRAAATSEGAERGEGAPASDRAGVWGGAPRDSEGAERGEGAPASDRAGGGRAPRDSEGAERGEGAPASDRAGGGRAPRDSEGAERGQGAPASDRAGMGDGAPRDSERAERGEGAPASDRAGVGGRAPRDSEGAERGEGAPASDRAGGGRAPRDSEGAERGEGAPASDRAGVWGRAPRDEDERIVKLESEIDDMNPQLFGPLMDALHTAGALDVFYTPVQMKKGRPGTLVTIIAFPERRQALTEILFRESTTIGVRYEEMSRTRLDRSIESVDTPYGPVRFKIARRGGEELNAAPEFDDCARLAAERGVSIKTVQAAAIKARLDGSAR